MRKTIVEYLIHVLGILLLIMTPIDSTTTHKNHFSSTLLIKRIIHRKKSWSFRMSNQKGRIPLPTWYTTLITMGVYRYPTQNTHWN